MLSPIQKRKLSYLFEIFDANHNGELEFEDFQYVGKNICAGLKIDSDFVDYDRIMRICKDMYAKAICKISPGLHDPITLEKWLEYFSRSSDNAIVDEFVNLTVNYVFGAFDEDRDGNININEYANMFRVYGIDTTYSEKGFRQVDTDGNQEISKEELQDALTEFLTSPDPNARGNWIFGNWN